MKTLTLPPHPRHWEPLTRVCTVCGETHACHQPTPSGRACVPGASRASPKPIERKATTYDRACVTCAQRKPLREFSGPRSNSCLACRMVRVDAAALKKAKAPVKDHAYRVALKAAANKRAAARLRAKRADSADSEEVSRQFKN